MRPCVTELRVDEPARFNPERLESLCNTMGETAAEAEVAHALDRIAAVVRRLPSLDDDARPPALIFDIGALAKDADLIGMATLARVSRDVLACLSRNDDISTAATLARLARVGERSIHAVWELEDLSG